MKKHLIILMLLLLTSCSQTKEDSPEQQIRQVLANIEQGIEDRSLSAVMDNIDDNYNDHQGRTKKDLKRYLQLQILRNQNITIFSKIRSLEVNQQLASIELSAASAARGVDLNIETNRLKADSHRASIVLTETNDGWKVTSSSWNRGW